MKFTTIAIIVALLVVGSVKADTESCSTSVAKCTDTPCLDAIKVWKTCTQDEKKCATTAKSLSEYTDCLKSCTSPNADAQAYADKYVACIDGSIFRFALVALVGLFFAL